MDAIACRRLAPTRLVPLFIFLDLLKCDAEILAQLFLAHSEHIAAKPDATANMDVDRIRFLLVVFCHFFLAEFFRLFDFFLPKRSRRQLPQQNDPTDFEKFSGALQYEFLMCRLSIHRGSLCLTFNRATTSANSNMISIPVNAPLAGEDTTACPEIGTCDIDGAAGIDRQRIDDAPARIDDGRDAGVGSTQQGQSSSPPHGSAACRKC